MDTTAVAAELIVGGLQTLTWITFIALTVLGPSALPSAVNSSLAGSALALAVAYALGVVFDRVWDFILHIMGIHDRIRTAAAARAAPARSKSKLQDEIDQLRCGLYGADIKIAVAFVDYSRSRMRVARASFFNFSLITVTGLALVAVHFGGIVSKAFVLVLLLGSCLSAVSGLAFWELSLTNDRLLRQFGGAAARSSATA
jgi:hypothetical protein